LTDSSSAISQILPSLHYAVHVDDEPSTDDPPLKEDTSHNSSLCQDIDETSEEEFEPPRKMGKGFSSDVTGDGPGTLSKGTIPLERIRVGHRPQVIRFLIDSGCSHHMVDSTRVHLSKTRPANVAIRGIDPDKPMVGNQVGSFGPLSSVLGVPGLTQNLISVGAACKAGYKFLFTLDGAYLYKSTDVLFSDSI
jgi:hypothetical protein